MKAFCETCRDIVEYRIKMIDKVKKIKGSTVKYTAKVAYCDICKEEIFVPGFRDYNLEELDAAYRKIGGLISVEDIEKILSKYNIGKRPLSLLLGWGEGTVTRYLDGDIPSKLYSDTLKRIIEDEQYYRELLEQNKVDISEVAYRKSMAAVEEISRGSMNSENKLEAAAKYLLIQASEITPLALQKLLYFSQGFQKAFTGRFMFKEDCEAWAHGPVYRMIFEQYRNYACHPIEGEELAYDQTSLTEDEIDMLSHIANYYGCYSGKILEYMTHTEEPWRLARRGLENWESSDRIIEKEAIASYFSNVKEKYKMLNPTDIKDYSKDLFSKLY
jgi:uncharacterized phage-associated protein